MYYLYHIPGKKIGVTRDLNNRVTRQQGYSADEYEVLLTSDDIDYISDKEIELQQSYGYKVDRQSYKKLINKNNQMKINATEQTSTSPSTLDKLKGKLIDNLNLSWETSNGKFEITKENIPWIIANARTSMFNDNRSYIYNKAFYEAFFNQKHTPVTIEDLDSLRVSYHSSFAQDNRFELIREWAKERGIFDKNETLWASYGIRGKKQNLYLSGDSGWFKGLYEISERLGPFDVTFFEIGAYGDIRGWKEVHYTPEQAVEAHQAVRGKLMVPSGWATFDLGMFPWHEPIERFQIEANQAGIDYLTPKIGEVLVPGKPGGREKWWKPFINKTQ